MIFRVEKGMKLVDQAKLIDKTSAVEIMENYFLVILIIIFI